MAIAYMLLGTILGPANFTQHKLTPLPFLIFDQKTEVCVQYSEWILKLDYCIFTI